MKKFPLLLAFVACIFVTKMYAQPTFYLPNSPFQVPFNVVVLPGDQVCKTVKVLDFTDIIAVDLSMNWDPQVLQFQSVSNLNPNVINYSLANFNTAPALINNGQLTLSWESSNTLDCNSFPNQPPGVTLDDFEILYEVCFTAVGEYAELSPITFSDNPLEQYVTRLNANCLDIGEFTTGCSVSVGVSPVIFDISSASGQVGDQVCVDVSVDQFEEIVSMQFSMNWDCDVVTLASVETSNLPTWNTGSQVNIDNDCFLTASWFDTGNGETLPDGTTILTLCFDIVGEGGDITPVCITDSPTDLEVINDFCSNNSGCDINELVNKGSITVEDFNPDAINIEVDDAIACQGESFCLDLTAGEFDEIIDMGFTLSWNPGVLQFDGIQNINSNFPNSFTYLPNNPGDDFDESQINQGNLGVLFETQTFNAVTLADGATIFSICFTVIGDGGSNSVVSITNALQEIIVRDRNDPNSTNGIGINANNGLVNIKPSDGITVSAGSTTGFPGQEVCVDVTVQNFEDIERMAYSINWNGSASVLQYAGVQAFGLPDMMAFNFLDDVAINNGASFIGVEWETFGGPVTVPDGTTIFQICFNIIGDPGECTNIEFGDDPFPIDVESANSGNANIGITAFSGEICVENPLEVELNPTNVFGAPGQEVCVDFSSVNFTQLTGTQFAVSFDETLITFQGINSNIASFNNNSFNDQQADNGIIIIDWEATGINGSTLSNGDPFFEMCFLVNNGATGCSSIQITETQLTNIIVTSAPTGNANLGLSSVPGSVCVTDVPEVTCDSIVNVDCPGDDTGLIDLLVTGGTGNYNYNWSGPNINSINQNAIPPLSGLSNGIYTITVTDTGGSEIITNCEIGISDNAPVADAGGDVTLACDSLQITLDGTGSTQGPEITYNWVALGSFGLVPGDQRDKINPTVAGNDLFELTVTNIVTGCVVKDTIRVFNPIIPSVDLGIDTTVTCAVDTFQVDGAGNSFGPGFTLQWTTAAGGVIRTGTEEFPNPVLESAGEYYLTIIHDGSGCFKSDTLLVMADTIAPPADAGMPQGLGCNDQSVVLDASGSGVGFTYEWSTVDGEICNSTPDQVAIEACAIAEYTVTVTDPLNGCTATDMVMVMGDTLRPISNAGMDTTLTCLVDTILLDGSLSTQGDTITYDWMLNSMMVGNALTYETDQQGTYTLVVTNENNGCSATSTVNVGLDDTVPQILSAAATFGALDCVQTTDTLTATSDALNADYQWVNANMDTFTGAITEVNIPGNYTLTVTNNDNGCTAETMVEIADNQLFPEITAGDDKAINCIDDSVELDGALLTPIPNVAIQWSTSTAGCLTNSTDLMATASCGTDYILTVQNTDNNCITRDTVTVVEDFAQPVFENPLSGTLTCQDETADISVTLSGVNVVDVDLTWSFAMNVIAGATDLTLTAAQPGFYTINAVHQTSGCTASETINVTEDINLPNADAGADLTATCADPMVTIDGSGSIITDTTTIQWFDGNTFQPVGGINETDLMVGAGLYILVVNDLTNGCTNIDSLIVTPDEDLPIVSAGLDANLGCLTDMVLLNGSGSSANPVSFSWLDENDVEVGTTNIIEVSMQGIYTLIVTDDNNGCSNSDEVEVGFEVDAPAADAMSDSDDCTNEGALFANLPENAIGMWSVVSGGSIMQVDTNETTVTNLPIGTNGFIWTLSLGNCINYSTDTTFITTEFADLTANLDAPPAYPAGTQVITENLLDNDITGGADIEFSTIGLPTIGTIDSVYANGEVVWDLPQGFFGNAEVEYQICSNICSVCDTSIFRIQVLEGSGNFNVPNGITPNNDGLNDELVFDQIRFAPNSFPNSKITIFNRWGDIVYTAQPYLNNWAGTNESGDRLPDGTYYYILRLDIAQSEIIRGDVTILK